MNKIIDKNRNLPAFIRGMVFAVVLMFFFTSCCITGYCRTSTAENTTKESEQTIKQ